MKRVILVLSLTIATLPVLAGLRSARIGGFVGKRIDDCIAHRVLAQNVDHITDPFKDKNDSASWRTEFWGKWVQGAINSYRYNRDPGLLEKIRHSVESIMATQQPDGYIGNYSPDKHLKQWDVWGRKYTSLGLLSWYRLTGDKKALHSVECLIDHLMTEVGDGEGKASIVKIGNYIGLACSSILEPVIYLYNETGKQKYLDFAKYIVAEWEKPYGPKLITMALNGVGVGERSDHPTNWFSHQNGLKAYEMMSCYVGLLELYKLTGNKTYLDAVEKTVANIVDKEINIAGSGSSFESWCHGKDFQNYPTYHTMETCVTFTWMQLCDKLLEITGKPFYADQIEKTMYNSLMASLKGDASQIAKYSPLEGHRFEGEEQCGLHINCCNANGPRGFAMIPDYALKVTDRSLDINYYGEMEADADMAGTKVKLSQESTYPVGNTSVITVTPESSKEFTLNLRIPAWSAATKVSVNGLPIADICPGSYLPIFRQWKKGDKVEIEFEMPVKVVKLNMTQAFTRGPIVFARDSRFADGFTDESLVVTADKDGIVTGAQTVTSPDFAWITLEIPVTVGQNLEGQDADRKVKLCDFASAGNTWSPDVRYRVWLPETLNIRKKRHY